MSKLVIFLPDAGEVAHELTEAKVSVGRTDENAICINDASVSTHHAEFVLSAGEYVLRDIGSTNGTRVNGEKISEARLCPGDRVRFGSIEGVFEPDVKGSSPLPPVEAAHHTPADQSQRPSDFGNASPFSRKAVKRDPVRTGAFVAAGIALLAFLVSIGLAFALRGPAL